MTTQQPDLPESFQPKAQSNPTNRRIWTVVDEVAVPNLSELSNQSRSILGSVEKSLDELVMLGKLPELKERWIKTTVEERAVISAATLMKLL